MITDDTQEQVKKKQSEIHENENETEMITERDTCTTFLTLITTFATHFNIIYDVYINILRRIYKTSHKCQFFA